ncbi:glycoside hydrolase family 43 [Kribbella flavida DSM 17836]|uniref:Glycoside hydrolase family 43 n=1 Tax=Kribbella flavida (strain DSM 17836 / JCM 10339 / NBRC 14399) TaxID=479435 RepID=D2PQJ1_KRIFD|nr:family 43 glycosylhydrolase [Kribbella flavida]ADB29178.1 glycoside hydrolase family 43 [Kribbella flavida DSM 17836]
MPRRILAAALAVAAVAAGTTAAVAAPPLAVTTQNDISKPFADTYADPAIIQGRDGYWYAYATSDPLVANGPFGLMHMARTKDFGSWEYLGTVFSDATKPAWAAPGSFFWAPDIRYFGGRYVMYFTVTDTAANPGGDPAIGVATAPTPAGPWTATGGPVVTPKPDGNGGYFGTIDPAMLTAADGKRYLYYGGFYGGLWVTELTPDGLQAVGTPTQVAIGDRYEGSYAVYRDGWYYLTASSSNCCAGPTTGYSVFAGRSKSPRGPFLDADGASMNESRVGGTTVLTQNGNKWIGPGHHAFFTDAAGQDHILYHAIDRAKPWLTDPFGINRRPMLVDRLDWIDGWPRTRAGAGPSETPQPAPVTGSAAGITPADPASGLWNATRRPGDALGGPTAQIRGVAATRQSAPAGSVRVSADVRLGASFTTVLGYGAVVASIVGDKLVLVAGGRTTAVRLPAGFDRSRWNRLAVQVTGSTVTARISDAGLGDLYAEARLVVPKLKVKAAPVRWLGQAEVDNLTIRPVAEPVRRMVAVPQPGKLLAGDEFNGSGLGAGWSWLRPDAAATVANGKLSWPLQDTDLVGGGNNAGLLFHRTPAGDRWIAETKLHLDLGEGDIRNYQQAGMIVHRTDDDFARLGNVAIWRTRQTEYGRELVARPSDGATSYGGAAIGRSAPDLWMRLAFHRNAAGEHVYRAATSVGGKNWTWGAAWVLPAGETPRLGLYAHGDFTGADPAPVATFDYLRFYESK